MNRILNKRLLALLYPWVLSCAILYLFVPERMGQASAWAFFACTVFFVLFSAEQKLKRTAPLVYLLYAAAVSGTFYYFTYREMGAEGLMAYLLAESRDITFGELFGLIFAVCFMQCSLSFYFTEVRYRQSGLLLITLIPCAFYVQQGEALRNSYIAGIVILFLLIAVFYRREPDRIRTKSLRSNAALPAVGLLAAIAACIAVALPFPEDPPLGYVIEEYLPEFQAQRTSRGAENRQMGEYAEVVSADYYQELTDEILFYVKSDEPLYLRKQVYDVYEPAQGWRVLDDENMTKGSSGWEDDAAVRNPQASYAEIVKAAQEDTDFAQKYGLQNLPQAEENTAAEKSAQMIPYQYQSFHLLNALYTTGYPELEFSTYRNLSGEIFRTRDYEVYDLDQYTFTYVPEMTGEQAGALSLDSQEDADFLTDLYWAQKGDSNADSPVLQAIYANTDALTYEQLTAGEIPAKIQSLADTLTADCEGDYEKAASLMRYFSQNHFYYDLYYIPPVAGQNNAEYFLFESRRGVCSDYASAMTLMARAAGLPARYVSGFYAGESSDAGTYVVRQNDAHAFCEIYITGAGWMTFDATTQAEDVTAEPDNGGGFLENLDLPLQWILLAAGGITLGLAVFFLRGKIRMAFVKRRVFGTRLGKFIPCKKAAPKQGAVRLFVAARKLLYGRDERERASAAQVRERARARFDADISYVTDCFEQVCYGKQPAVSAELETAFMQYKVLYRAVRHEKKPGKRRNKRKMLDKIPQNGV